MRTSSASASHSSIMHASFRQTRAKRHRIVDGDVDHHQTPKKQPRPHDQTDDPRSRGLLMTPTAPHTRLIPTPGAAPPHIPTSPFAAQATHEALSDAGDEFQVLEDHAAANPQATLDENTPPIIRRGSRRLALADLEPSVAVEQPQPLELPTPAAPTTATQHSSPQRRPHHTHPHNSSSYHTPQRPSAPVHHETTTTNELSTTAPLSWFSPVRSTQKQQQPTNQRPPRPPTTTNTTSTTTTTTTISSNEDSNNAAILTTPLPNHYRSGGGGSSRAGGGGGGGGHLTSMPSFDTWIESPTQPKQRFLAASASQQNLAGNDDVDDTPMDSNNNDNGVAITPARRQHQKHTTATGTIVNTTTNGTGGRGIDMSDIAACVYYDPHKASSMPASPVEAVLAKHAAAAATAAAAEVNNKTVE